MNGVAPLSPLIFPPLPTDSGQALAVCNPLGAAGERPWIALWRAIKTGKTHHSAPPSSREEIRARHLAYMSDRRKRLRVDAISKYGGKCTRCGFSDPRALQFDHVHGGGTRELKKHGMKPSYYKMILENMDGKYQLLCANCNWIKRHEEKEGPQRQAAAGAGLGSGANSASASAVPAA